MAKLGSSSKSKWAQFGLGWKSQNTVMSGAPVYVSEDAHPKYIDRKAANLVQFNNQLRDRLPERPSTSAGPTSSFTRKRNIEKRETQDDLFFNPLAVHGKETTFYNFPLPGSLPTPTASPKSLAPSTHRFSPDRPSTPESLEIILAPSQAATMNVPQSEIGMALGSPSHAPLAWQDSSLETYIRHESPDQMDGSVDGSYDSSVNNKQKPSRWKILGGMFGGVKKAQPAFYQLQTEQPQVVTQPPTSSVPERASSEKRPKSRGRGWSASTRRKNKPDMTRANTTSEFEMSGGRDVTVTPDIRLDGEILVQSASQFPQNGANLLDVDIPSIQMERYSIMFSGVLPKKPQQTSSSLLARRQATLDKLKTVNEALALKEQEIEEKQKLLSLRRATSPSTMTFRTQSPSLSLFPIPPSRREQSPGPRHRGNGSLQRSNTSPAALSPSRPTFAPGPDNAVHAQLMTTDSGRTSLEKNPNKKKDNQGKESFRLKNLIERPLTATSTSKSAQWSPTKSHLALDDNSDGENEVGNWQIINSQTTTPSMHSTSASNSSSNSTPPTTGLPAKPNMPSPALTSSISPKAQAQAQARARALSSLAKPSQSEASTINPLLVQRQQPLAETIDSPTLHPEPMHSLNSTISPLPSKIPIKSRHSSEEEEEMAEAHLKSLADVSIARQISVSRQQRQLIVPIKTSLKSATSNGSLKRSPSQSIKGGAGINVVNVAKIASPLTAVATAANEERERAASPLAGKGSERGEKEKENEKGIEGGIGKGKERVMDVVKPNTPTLVVMGESSEGREQVWAGATQSLKTANGGLEERRRLLAKNASPAKTQSSSGSTAGKGVQAIKVGPLVANREKERRERGRGDERAGAVEREKERERDRAVRAREKELRDMQNRKSERVVVESVGVVAN